MNYFNFLIKQQKVLYCVVLTPAIRAHYSSFSVFLSIIGSKL